MKKLLTFFNILMIGIVSFNLYTVKASEVLFSKIVNDNGDNYIAYNVVLDDVINTELGEEEIPIVVEDEKETVVSTTTVNDKINDKKMIS